MKIRTYLGLAGILLGLIPSLSFAQNGVTGTLHSYAGIFSGAAINVSYAANGLGGAPGSTYNGVGGVQDMQIDIPAYSVLNQPISLFCIQLDQSGLGAFTFREVDVNLMGRYSGGGLLQGTADSREADLIKLYQAVFSTAYTPKTVGANWGVSNGTAAVAFQLAVWNVIYGGGFTPVDAGNNGFQGNTSADAQAFATANAMLSAASAVVQPAAFSLFALSLPGGQDYVVPFYGDRPGVTTPEPATYALLVGLGTLGVVSIRRRFMRTP